MVSSFYPPYRGGGETYVSSLSQRLVKRGHTVTVYSAQTPCSAGETSDMGVRVIRMQTHGSFYGTPLSFFPPDFLSEKFDIIHCNFPNPYFSLVSAAVSRLRGIPSVLTWHNDVPEVTPVASVLVHLHDVLSTVYLAAYDKIIATTNVYAKTSPTLKRFSRKVEVISNGVDTLRFKPGNNGTSIRSRLKIDEGTVLVAFVGALTPWHTYKGLDIAISAMQKIVRSKRDVKLMIVGGGGLLGFYRERAATLGVSSNVLFVGTVSDATLPEYYAACDLLVLPSKDRSEGFGLVLLEAMATAKPVIASKTGGISEIVREDETGMLVEPNDVEGLADAILRLAGDSDIRRTLGLAGRRFAELHDWNLITERTDRLYREVVNTLSLIHISEPTRP